MAFSKSILESSLIVTSIALFTTSELKSVNVSLALSFETTAELDSPILFYSPLLGQKS